MATNDPPAEATWVPAACILPTAERPLRTAEFDELFATSVRSLTRPEPTRLTLDLHPGPETAARAADLMARETDCCGFFTFTLTAGSGTLHLDITVPTAHTTVLDSVTTHATTIVTASS